MKSEVKAGTIMFNGRNHGTNNNYVLFIIKTNKMFPIEATDPDNWVLENLNKHPESFFESQFNAYGILSTQAKWYLLWKEVTLEL